MITLPFSLCADSEHSAIFQCIQGLPENGLRRIILTASGGAFRDWPVEKLQHVKVGMPAPFYAEEAVPGGTPALSVLNRQCLVACLLLLY